MVKRWFLNVWVIVSWRSLSFLILTPSTSSQPFALLCHRTPKNKRCMPCMLTGSKNCTHHLAVGLPGTLSHQAVITVSTKTRALRSFPVQALWILGAKKNNGRSQTRHVANWIAIFAFTCDSQMVSATKLVGHFPMWLNWHDPQHPSTTKRHFPWTQNTV